MVALSGTATAAAAVVALLAAGALGPEEAAAEAEVIKKGDNYRVRAAVAAGSAGAASGELRIAIEPTGKWKMDRDKGPATLTLEPPAGLKLERERYEKSDAEWKKGGERIRYRIPFERSAKGPHTVKLGFRFVLCTDKLCQMKRFELDYQLGD
jgi:hypothetical protein